MKINKRKDIILFGLKALGQTAFELLKSTYNIRYISDNDKSKWGEIYKGVVIISPDRIKFYNYSVIIASESFDKIAYQLFQQGVYKFEIFDHQYYTEKWNVKIKDEKKPHFLCIGAQKAGTTWLHENLKKHPQIHLPKRKELHYFDKHISNHMDYASFFESEKKLKGEITPAYSNLSYERINLVRELFTEMKIILLLRHPINRVWSHVMMSVCWGKGKKINEVPDSEIYNRIQAYDCIMRTNYINIIENWKAVFPKEQIYIGMFKEIKDNPKKLLNDIFSFLNVSTKIDWDELPYKVKIHSGHYNTIPAKYKEKLWEMYSAFLDELKKVNIQFD